MLLFFHTDEVTKSRSLDTTLALLQTAAAEAEEESEVSLDGLGYSIVIHSLSNCPLKLTVKALKIFDIDQYVYVSHDNSHKKSIH